MVRIASKQPRKQRKARYNAPHHQRGSLMHASLAKDLREQYQKRSTRVIHGDTVKVMRGSYAGHEGVVDIVKMKKLHIIVDGVTVKKADGTEVPLPVDPSNVMIVKLNLDDGLREEILKRK